ncbi:MAG: UDP-N-acetylglucosamine 1-carboxyvinyltransferase [Candidatus Cloacimonetes bacterium]|nr:UDP-N-acetylglucosamine 1-carboxyvinyltransferase [Candidatus Cloacimonadota bacterium]
MDKFRISGRRKLSGNVAISGSKNAALPIMVASLLASGKFKIENVPNLRDTRTMAKLLRMIGAKIDFSNGEMKIDTTNAKNPEAPYDLVKTMRASIYVLGPLLAKFGKAKVSFPGGCAIGPRPIDLHIKVMKELGANVEVKHGYIQAECNQLVGNKISFQKRSVGATANALMASVLAKGETIIENAAQEPEISNLIDFLNKMGANIKGNGTDILRISGVSKLNPVEIEIIPDRIEAGTFLLAGAITKSEIAITNCIPEHLKSLIEKLEQAGFKFEIKNNEIKIIPVKTIRPVDIITKPYPDFPTDLQAQFMALMTLSNGKCFIEETIFQDRFMHIAELNRLDADIRIEKNIAIINGVKSLSGAEVMASDLRASAALVLAGLAAKGETIIHRIYHIDRGYEKIEEKLSNLGAKIERIGD